MFELTRREWNSHQKTNADEEFEGTGLKIERSISHPNSVTQSQIIFDLIPLRLSSAKLSETIRYRTTYRFRFPIYLSSHNLSPSILLL